MLPSSRGQLGTSNWDVDEHNVVNVIQSGQCKKNHMLHQAIQPIAAFAHLVGAGNKSNYGGWRKIKVYTNGEVPNRDVMRFLQDGRYCSKWYRTVARDVGCWEGGAVAKAPIARRMMHLEVTRAKLPMLLHQKKREKKQFKNIFIINKCN